MNSSIILALDVGGTQIKAAAVIEGAIVASTITHYPAHSDQSTDEIIRHFARIAADLVAKSGRDELPVGGIGLAFPGPFDYEQGISHIRGLGKFESLYGLPVGKLLEIAVRANEVLSSRLAPTFGIKFENDAALFGLGEASYGEATDATRVICLTIGTGLGSCYLDNGCLVKHRDGVPDNGWLYSLSYEDGIADEYVSRRGFLRLAEEMKLLEADQDVHHFAALAGGGDVSAIRLFEAFGRRMGAILASSLRAYTPDRIVIGGQISKSGHLFVPAFQSELETREFQSSIRLSKDTLSSTFLGIYDFFHR